MSFSNLLTVACGLLFLGSAASARHALPPSAKITIGTLQTNKSVRYDAEECGGWTLNDMQVRQMFLTYHKLKSRELHAYYLFPACWISGTVQVAHKTYHWEARPGNTLETDWPDDVKQMLGGERSDDPSSK
jgi:hypothetical protein